VINNELVTYDGLNSGKEGYLPLADRRQIVVFNKVDAIGEDDLETLRKRFKKTYSIEPKVISAVTGLGVKDLVTLVGRHILNTEEEDNA
jgi:GTPase involved in cell partitioning and DNA repair